MKRIALVLLCASAVTWAEGNNWTAYFGAGPSFPVGKTGDFVHSGAMFEAGGGYRFSERQSVLLQYLASPLPLNQEAFDRLRPLDLDSTLYTVTANYRFVTRTSGFLRPYFIAGGGWYRRVTTLAKIDEGAVIACSSALLWFDYACTTGFVPLSEVVKSPTSDALGFNAGAGVVIAPRKIGPHIFVEVRYHSASSAGVPTRLMPLVVGLTW